MGRRVAKQQPKFFPWEKNADMFFSRTVPETENLIDKRINELKSYSLAPVARVH